MYRALGRPRGKKYGPPGGGRNGRFARDPNIGCGSQEILRSHRPIAPHATLRRSRSSGSTTPESPMTASPAPVSPARAGSGPPTTPVKHDSAFRVRRVLNWFPLGLTYATFYMGRYNFNVVKGTMG